MGGTRGEEISYYNFRTDTGELLSLMDLIDGTQEEIGSAAADTLAAAYPTERPRRWWCSFHPAESGMEVEKGVCNTHERMFAEF